MEAEVFMRLVTRAEGRQAIAKAAPESEATSAVSKSLMAIPIPPKGLGTEIAPAIMTTTGEKKDATEGSGKKHIPAKDKAAAIYMIQSWQRVTRQKVTQSFDRFREIVFPPLTANEGVEGPLVIEA
ncbi:hypothetical protein Tco_0268570 [Tanacetum coccineum]